MTNEYGARLDRNGYTPSILWDDGCRYCGNPETVRHEVFYGSGRREKCKRLGLWVSVCPTCHGEIHDNRDVCTGLRAWAQRLAMAYYGWSIEDFRREFYNNYLED